MKSTSAGQHFFSQVPTASIPRSQFNMSKGYKTTFDSSWLVPFFVDEALPGDTWNLKASIFARLATPIVPIMDNLFLETFFFAVPYRLVWTHWEKFNGAQDNPGDSTSFTIPQTTSPTGGYTVGSLQDYMGLPTAGQVGGGNTVTHNNLHPRAYNLIWNTWFRDENLQNSATVDTGDGPDTYSNYTLQRRGKRHDYFTSSLPWPQKGTAVTVPLGTTAPVKGIAVATTTYPSGPVSVYDTENAGSTITYAHAKASNAAGNDNIIYAQGDGSGHLQIFADLNAATAATINQLRQAFQIQKMYERDARGGTRYTEILRSHFRVVSPDFRLQRPEFLGGGSQRITINPVAQTQATGASGTTTPQGNLAGFGVVATNKPHGFVKSFTEHCLLIGLVNVRADLTYQQGMHKMWSRQTRFDFYWPALSMIGEQAVLNQEIYCDGSGASGNDGGVFGYQERYGEYRYSPSQITGQFRSTYSSPLDVWHLAQKFTSLPTLGSAFINENVPLSRVLAAGSGASGQQLIMDCLFETKTARPMPTYGVPGLIDHF